MAVHPPGTLACIGHVLSCTVGAKRMYVVVFLTVKRKEKAPFRFVLVDFTTLGRPRCRITSRTGSPESAGRAAQRSWPVIVTVRPFFATFTLAVKLRGIGTYAWLSAVRAGAEVAVPGLYGVKKALHM